MRLHEEFHIIGSVELAQIKGLHTKEMRNALGTPPPYDTVIHRDNLLVMR